MRCLVAGILLLQACTSLGAVPVTTPAQLNSEPERYNGQRVLVRGYVLLGTNSRALYQSREEYDRAVASQTSPPENCLTILNNDEFLWANASLLRNHTVVVAGTFTTRDPRIVDLQACLDTEGNIVPTGVMIDEASLHEAVRRLQPR